MEVKFSKTTQEAKKFEHKHFIPQNFQHKDLPIYSTSKRYGEKHTNLVSQTNKGSIPLTARDKGGE